MITKESLDAQFLVLQKMFGRKQPVNNDVVVRG